MKLAGYAAIGLLGLGLACVSPAQAQADRFVCVGPYGKINRPPILIMYPFGLRQKVPANATATFCSVGFPKTYTLKSMSCYRQEYGPANAYPSWRCPLGKDCFGGPKFERAYRMAGKKPNDDKFCMTFRNPSKYAQGVSVELDMLRR